MDLEQAFFKTFQYRLNTYCLANKPYLSLKFDLIRPINSTYFRLRPRFYQLTKGDQWTKQFLIMLSNENIPIISFSIIPFNFFSFDIIAYRYTINISQDFYSISLKSIRNIPILYSLSYIPGKIPTFLGDINIGDKMLISALINEKRFSLFYNYNYRFFFGVKFRKTASFFDSLSEIHIGFQTTIFNSIYFVGLGVSDSVGFSISRRKNNRRLTYIIRSDYNGAEDDFINHHYLQYKYIYGNKGKIGALYDFSKDELFVRGSVRFKNFQFHLKTKYDGKWCNPTFGLDINF